MPVYGRGQTNPDLPAQQWTDRDGNAIRTRTDDEIASTDRFGRPIPSRTNTTPPGIATPASFDPSQIRRAAAGLNVGGETCDRNSSYFSDTPVTVAGDSGVQQLSAEDDWRVKVSLAKDSEVFYRSNNPGIMARLKDTDGAIFPYTPQISVTHSARYAEQKLTHSNYASYFYEGSDVSAINISGDFSVQTPDEGQYLMAVIAFFRSCTKMFFGNSDAQQLAGNPPPMVFLNGYGKYYFPNVPCVITSFQHTMPGDVDYLEITPDTISGMRGQGTSESGINARTRLPVNSTVAITLQPVYSRKSVHETFNLDKFASGELLISGAYGNGGFI
jgi:hypothetical protein